MISAKELLKYALLVDKSSYKGGLYTIIPQIQVFKFYSNKFNRSVLIHNKACISGMFYLNPMQEDEFFICYRDNDWNYYNFDENKFVKLHFVCDRLISLIEFIKPNFSIYLPEKLNYTQLNKEYLFDQ